MDLTLVKYNTVAFGKLTHKVVLNRLVKDFNYPKKILKIPFEFNRGIRGLIVDKKNGNILKIGQYSDISISYHGLKAIDFQQQKAQYKTTYIDPRKDNFRTVDTSFSMAYVGLYAHLIERKDKYNLPSYKQIEQDLYNAIKNSHQDTSLKDPVKKNIKKYIIQTPEIIGALKNFIFHGKKLILITNTSTYSYTNALLQYTIDPFLEKGQVWQDLFTFTIIHAQKPDFFYKKRAFKFKIEPKTQQKLKVPKLLTPGIYSGGSEAVLSRVLSASAREILYIGDHIYGDVLKLKKSCGWRTGLVVEELDQEIQNYKKAKKYEKNIELLMKKKQVLEEKRNSLINKHVSKKYSGASIKMGIATHNGVLKKVSKGNARNREEYMDQIKKIDKVLSQNIRKKRNVFNPYWGEVMKSGLNASYFAAQIESYACVYMSCLTHFLKLNPSVYLRPNKRSMAHEE